MNERSIDRQVWLFALAAALFTPVLLPQSAHGMYDPKHGRWLQRDPAGLSPGSTGRQANPLQQYGDSRNLYEYVQSGPTDLADPAGQHGVRTLVSTENLDEPDLIAEAVKDGATGRGRTIPDFSRDARCSKEAAAGYFVWLGGPPPPPHADCYQMRIDATLKVHVRVVRQGHEAWKKHRPLFDDKWGSPRSDDREREATIAHEYDHRDTRVLGFWPQMISSKLAAFETWHFCEKECCERVKACVLKQIDELYFGPAGVVRHSGLFDSTWKDGGRYAEHPFTGKLDLAPCLAEMKKDCHWH